MYGRITKKELTIIKLLGDGFNSVEIANKLEVSTAHVNNKKEKARLKMNAKNTAQLINNCWKAKILK